jgi:putative ABC transport system permease protein
VIRDYLRLSMKSLRHRSLRSWLTVLGIVVGVAAVVALIAIGEGMQRSVEKQFETIGYNTVIVFPAPEGTGDRLGEAAGTEGAFRGQAGGRPGGMMGGFMGMRGGAGEASPVDMTALEALPMVVAAGAQRTETAMVTSEGMDGQGFLRLSGMTPSMPTSFPGYFGGYIIAEGRTFAADDLHVVVLGASVAQDMVVGVGDEIVIETTPFEVIGILGQPDEEGRGGFTIGNMRNSLFVPIAALEDLYEGVGTITQALVEVTDGTDIEQASQLIRAAFTQAGTPVMTTTASEMSAQIKGVLSSLNMTLSAIAGISLLVGAIGVMNTMYMSVLERTREIGIMKAVGARDKDVLGLFLIESSLLGILGGALGVLLGVGISGLAGRFISGSLTLGAVSRMAGSAGLQPAFSAWLICAALGLSLVLGALAGVLPARRGAKLPPVKALRYE